MNLKNVIIYDYKKTIFRSRESAATHRFRLKEMQEGAHLPKYSSLNIDF